jgi:hypothetical protein
MNIASSKVNFKVTQKCDKNCNNLQSDEIEKIIQVKDSAVMESVATI